MTFFADGSHTDDGLDDVLVRVPEHHNDLGDWCPRSGEYSADGSCPLFCRHADDQMGIDAGRDEDEDEEEEDDRSGTRFGDWLDERPLDEELPQLDCRICGGKHFERAGIENCAADHGIDPPGGYDLPDTLREIRDQS